eukprot:Em0008g476a
MSTRRLSLTASSKSKGTSSALTVSAPIWQHRLFSCDWSLSQPTAKYSLKELITQQSNWNKDSEALCSWLIERYNSLSPEDVELCPVCESSRYKSVKDGDTWFVHGPTYYLLDKQKYSPLLNLRPFVSSLLIFPDVGIVYKPFIVLHCEINSSSMTNTVAKLAANLTDELRFERHYDPNISKIVAFVVTKRLSNVFMISHHQQGRSLIIVIMPWNKDTSQAHRVPTKSVNHHPTSNKRLLIHCTRRTQPDEEKKNDNTCQKLFPGHISSTSMATNTSLTLGDIHGYQHLTPSTRHSAYIHGWLPTHHSKSTRSTPMATNTSLQEHSGVHPWLPNTSPSTLRVHPWLPTHSKYTWRTPMATNTSLQVHSEYTHGYQHITPNTLGVHHGYQHLIQVHSEYTHGYQHITPSTLRVHPWLPTHHSSHSEYIHGYQHITPSTLRVHPWLPTPHSKYTQSTSMATNTSLQVLRVHPWLPTPHSKYTQSTSMAPTHHSIVF